MILISPYSRELKNGKRNPKNYPWWEELIKTLRLETSGRIIQIGTSGEIRLNYLSKLEIDLTWEEILSIGLNKSVIISVDNAIPHFANYYGFKSVVLWGQSDPLLFGYPENINILKDKKYLRPNQYGTWEEAEYMEEAFASPEEVFNQIKHLL